MSDLWVVPQHIIKDRLNDGSWALDPKNWVFAGPYKLEARKRANNGLCAPTTSTPGPSADGQQDRLHAHDPQVRFAAFKNGEVESFGGEYHDDLPPSQWPRSWPIPRCRSSISWPNFMTYYLFFDTWNPPFDNLKVRQAFSHAIDRDKLVNGPLQYQARPPTR